MSQTQYTREEVYQHSSPGDAWVVISGGVYDVSHYLGKHPGGASLLLKAAGKDATDNFKGVFHSKKAEGILATLQIGVCKDELPKSSKKGAGTKLPVFFEESTTSSSEEIPTPKREPKKHISKTIDSKRKQSSLEKEKANMASSSPILDLPPKKPVASRSTASLLKPGDAKRFDSTRTLPKSKEVPLPTKKDKDDHKDKDKDKEDKKEKKDKDKEDKKRKKGKGPIDQEKLTTFELVEISWLSHDVNLYKFKIEDKKALNIPIGHHITLVQTIDGDPIKREYTPVTDKPGVFELAVKTYKTYGISEHLAHLETGEKIQARGPYGSWTYKPKEYSRICMYAAGSGITPMYQVLSAISKESSSSATKCSLIFCNKKQADMIFKKRLDTWAGQGFLNVTYVLSQAADFSGYKGRISKEIVNQCLGPKPSDEKELHLICGPDGFVASVQKILESLNVPKPRVHTF